MEALRDPRHKVAAAQALLDRGWGKPTQTIETTGDSTVLHLIAAQAISAELLELQPPPPAIDHQAVPADLNAPALE